MLDLCYRGWQNSVGKVLDEMGNKYGKTFAQVILRYQIECGVIVVPNSRQYVMGFPIIWNLLLDICFVEGSEPLQTVSRFFPVV